MEIGFGSGDFLSELDKRGLTGKGIDLSDEAMDQARIRLQGCGRNISLSKENFLELNERFAIIFAFEILEHFDDDGKALKKMHDLLEENGHLMLSVPARMKHWGPNDEWAGHVRRYERDELKHKAEMQGFETIAIHSFGVPIANMTKIFYDRLVSRQMNKEAELDAARKTERSWKVPVAKSLQPLLGLIFNRFLLFPFLLLQCLFLGTDFGTGYLAIFKKE